MVPRSLTVLIMALLLGGCGLYQSHGYGKVARSPLPKQSVTPVVLPPDAPSISQRFRPVDLPLDGGHKGFDIFVPHGTPVLAAAPGTVSQVDLSLLYGKRIFIDHARVAEGFRLQTRYFHLTEQRVDPGQRVARGELIGYSGVTGLTGLYPHLHFETRRLNEQDSSLSVEYLDPQRYWVDGIGRVTCYRHGQDYAAEPVLLTYPVPCRGVAWE